MTRFKSWKKSGRARKRLVRSPYTRAAMSIAERRKRLPKRQERLARRAAEVV